MKLGLIGRHIGKSQAGRLHEYLGRYYRTGATYDLFDVALKDGEALADFFSQLRDRGYRGVNVTHPYKQTAWELITRRDNTEPGLGALNTVLLDEPELRGTNTDFSGFVRVMEENLPEGPVGPVLIQGAGGVGRAIAFALARCGAREMYLYDESQKNARSLADSLKEGGFSLEVMNRQDLVSAISRCEGLVNATPVGHHSTAGTVFPAPLLGPQKWVFDAVYSPLQTQFLGDAQKAGVKIISGFELFLGQGIDAFSYFSGQEADPLVVREFFRLPE